MPSLPKKNSFDDLSNQRKRYPSLFDDLSGDTKFRLLLGGTSDYFKVQSLMEFAILAIHTFRLRCFPGSYIGLKKRCTTRNRVVTTATKSHDFPVNSSILRDFGCVPWDPQWVFPAPAIARESFRWDSSQSLRETTTEPLVHSGNHLKVQNVVPFIKMNIKI